jgi:hypothetical protein
VYIRKGDYQILPRLESVMGRHILPFDLERLSCT